MADDKDKKDDEKLDFDLVEVDEAGKPLAPTPGEGQVEKKAAPPAEDEPVEDDEENERLSLSDEDREARRQERRLRAERRKEHNRRRELELAELRNNNAELAQRLQSLEQRGNRFDAALLGDRLETAKGQLAQAESLLAQALTGKDPAKVAQALSVRDNARDAYNRLGYVKEQLTRGARFTGDEGVPDPRRAAPAAPAVDPVVTRKVGSFTKKHEWFDLQGGDRESKIVLLIDQEVAEEGFDPHTQEYWDEVEKRAAIHLPHRFKEAGRGGEGGGSRRSPPVAGNGQDARADGRVRVYISPERKKAMQDAGAWDDPAKRQRMLKRFAEYDKANPPARRAS